MRTQLKDLSAREAEVKKEVAQYRELLQRFGKMVDSGKLKVEVKNGRMVLALASDVLFPSASAELSEAGKAAIAEIAGVLKGVKDKTFQIEGHTDNVPIKTEQFASNWYLAMARAMVVLEAMLSGGVSPKVLSAASYAEYRPVGSNKTVPGRAANRRIEIVFVPYIAGLPDQSDLAKAAAEK
jgi:chemotaxis protein MotB